MSLEVLSIRPESPSINKLLRHILDLKCNIINSIFLIFEPAVVRHSSESICRLALRLGLDGFFESGARNECVNDLAVKCLAYSP